MTWDGGDESRVSALMAENERLREALRQIAEDTDFGDTKDAIAREALGLPKARG